MCIRDRFLNEAGTFFVPTPAKYKKEFPFLKEVDSGALCNTQLDLQDANDHHLESPKTVGAPRLKSKRKSKMSYTTNIHSYKTKDGSVVHTLALGYEAIKLPKIGWVKIKKHRQPGADWILKGATVSCTRSGKYFISLLYEFEKDIQSVVPTKEKSLGLDYSCLLYTSASAKADAPLCVSCAFCKLTTYLPLLFRRGMVSVFVSLQTLQV